MNDINKHDSRQCGIDVAEAINDAGRYEVGGTSSDSVRSSVESAEESCGVELSQAKEISENPSQDRMNSAILADLYWDKSQDSDQHGR